MSTNQPKVNMSISVLANTLPSDPTISDPKIIQEKEDTSSDTSLLGFVAFVIKTPINLVGMIPIIGIVVGVIRVTFALIANFVWYFKGVTLDKVLYNEKTRAAIQTNWREWRQNQCWRGIVECIPFAGGAYLLYYDLAKAGSKENPSFY